MQDRVEYSVGSDDGRSISFQKEESGFSGATVTIKFWHIVLVGTVIACITIIPHFIWF